MKMKITNVDSTEYGKRINKVLESSAIFCWGFSIIHWFVLGPVVAYLALLVFGGGWTWYQFKLLAGELGNGSQCAAGKNYDGLRKIIKFLSLYSIASFVFLVVVPLVSWWELTVWQEGATVALGMAMWAILCCAIGLNRVWQWEDNINEAA